MRPITEPFCAYFPTNELYSTELFTLSTTVQRNISVYPVTNVSIPHSIYGVEKVLFVKVRDYQNGGWRVAISSQGKRLEIFWERTNTKETKKSLKRKRGLFYSKSPRIRT